MIKNMCDVMIWMFLGVIFLFGFTQRTIAEDDRYLVVSIYQLIVTPERFLNKKVYVKGYYGGLGFDLYPTRIHAENQFIADSLTIVETNIESSKRLMFSPCLYRHVSLKAKFVKLRGYFSLVDVKDVYDAKSNILCWKAPVVDSIVK